MSVKVWRYNLSGTKEEPFEWAVIVLDSTGFFAAASDYGDYCKKWPGPGTGFNKDEDFRRVFLRFSKDYLLNKLAETEYDWEATKKCAKRELIQLRKDGFYTREEAREEWEWLDLCETVEEWAQHTSMQDIHEIICTDYDSDAKAFVDKIIPRLDALIKEDLQRDGVIPREPLSTHPLVQYA